MMPCKECLVYVMCRNKATIECSKLMEYVKEGEDNPDLREWFPNMTLILPQSYKLPFKEAVYLTTNDKWRTMDHQRKMTDHKALGIIK